MAGLAASVRVLLWKNWRVKQRESRLNRNRTARGQWLFPALLTDTILPLTVLLLFIMKFCEYNVAIGVGFGNVDTPVLRADTAVSDDDPRLMRTAVATAMYHEQQQLNASARLVELERKIRTLAFMMPDATLPHSRAQLAQRAEAVMQRITRAPPVSSALFMHVLPLLLQQSNQSLAVLDRSHARAFLRYLDREHRGSKELGIPSYTDVAKLIPFDEAMTPQQADELLRTFPAKSGHVIYASLDLRPVGTDGDAVALELMVLLHRSVNDASSSSKDQMNKYFAKYVFGNEWLLRFPGALPLQSEANLFIRGNRRADNTTSSDDASALDPFPAPAVVCGAVNTMLTLGQLGWRNLSPTSPLGSSVQDCELAVRDGGRALSPPLRRFLTHVAQQQRARDTLHTLRVHALPKRPQSTTAGQLETGIMLFMAYLFLWPFVRLVRDVVLEKEKQLKEYLLIMGLHPMALLLSWYVLYLGACVVLSAVAAALLSGAMFTATPASAAHFVLLLVTFASSILLLGVAVTPMFNQAKTAAATASLVYFVLGVGPFIRSLVGDDAMADSAMLDAVVSHLEAVSSPVAFMAALRAIVALDAVTGVIRPIVWETVRDPCATMATQSVGYLLLGWYLENVFPRTYGVQRRWYFVFQPSYWFPSRFRATAGSGRGDSAESAELLALGADNTANAPNNLEPHDATLREMPLRDFVAQFDPVLVVNALSKRYANGTEALRGVSFGVKKGEIFGLLGPNGAGKSTTLSILCGMLAPTSGDAVVSGAVSVARDPDAVRKSLSVCFQHNILFDDLSVDEHVQLVCALKRAIGVPTVAAAAGDALAAKLQQFGLLEKRDALAKTLSGGQKRKLSLVLALLDNARVVLLDEPTAGMDLRARLETWDALKRAVRHRAVILTTHSMHEAEALCENIGIVADGELRCCGSSLFLRERFGVGYKLTLVHHDAGSGGDGTSRTDTPTLLRAVRAHVPKATVVSDNKWETRLQLTDGDERRFAALFRDLDTLRARCALKRYAVAATDLEDVFVKVTEGEAVYNHAKDDDNASAAAKDDGNASDTTGSYGTVSSSSSTSSAMRSQLRALLVKRAKVALRDRKMLLAQYVWPIALFAVLIVAVQNVSLGDRSVETLTRLPHAAALSSAYLIASPPKLAPRVRELLQHVDARTVYRSAMSEQSMLDAMLHNETAMSFFAAAYISSLELRAAESALANASTMSLHGTGELVFALFYNESIARSLPVGLQELSQAYCRVSAPAGNRACQLTVKAGTLAFQHSKANWSAESVPLAAHRSNVDANIEAVDPTTDMVSHLVLACYLLLTLSSIVAYYAAPVVKERESGLKRQQYLHLATRAASQLYWTAHFVFDFVAYLLAAGAIIAVVVGLVTSLPRAVLLAWSAGLVLFGVAVLPFTYALSLLFASHSSAQSFMSYASLFQLIAAATVASLAIVPTLCVKAHAFAYALQLLPLYSLAMLMTNVAMLPLAPAREKCLRVAAETASSSSATSTMSSSSDPAASLTTSVLTSLSDPTQSVWSWSVSGCHFAALAASAVLYVLLLLACDQVQMYPTVATHALQAAWNKTMRALGCSSLATNGAGSGGYSAVGADASDLESAKCSLVVVEDVTKVFNAKKKKKPLAAHDDTDESVASANVNADGQVVALNGVSFSVERSDCVALLGVNGSGKSTMFEILTAGTAPTRGRAAIAHCDVTLTPQLASAHFGYCPQTNILFSDLTVREHLELFSQLRVSGGGRGSGRSGDRECAVIDALLARLDLVPVECTAAAQLSGGNKRRLMLALALLHDDVALLLLDEPSAGVDVVARRLMWRVLRAKRTGCLFTTHSMEEAEAVCANAIVLFKGNVVWSGSIPDLKQHTARGVAISLRLDSAVVLAPARVTTYVSAVHDLLADADTRSTLPPPARGQQIRCDDLERVWTMCHRRYRPATANYTDADADGGNGVIAVVAENRARREDWLASVIMRTRQQQQQDGSGDGPPSISIDAFVREWLIQEDLAALEHAVFAEQVTKFSGEQVTAVDVHSAGGSGSNTAAAYETNCTDAFGLAALFGVMEANKARFAVAQYSISELSLERVFEQFT